MLLNNIDYMLDSSWCDNLCANKIFSRGRRQSIFSDNSFYFFGNISRYCAQNGYINDFKAKGEAYTKTEANLSRIQ